MRNNLLKVCLIIAAIVIYLFNFKTLPNMSGTYVLRNSSSMAGPDLPIGNDTLKIINDTKFYSDYFGSGTYEMKGSFFNKKLMLNYKYQFGLAGCGATIKINRLFRTVKLVVNEDQNVYYEKLNE